MAEEDTDVDPADVLVTTGGQQVIDLVCKTLDRPRRRDHRRGADLSGRGARRSPPTRPTSCRSRWTATACASTSSRRRSSGSTREGRRPKFIYTIPNFQNPAGVTLSLPRRKRLVEVARERELLVLEDNPYGLLRYEGEPLPTLRSLDGGAFVIYLGTFSKILSPGIRLGWAVAPRPVLREDEPRQAGERPVLLVAVAAVRHPVLQRGPTGRTTCCRCATSTAAGATRCSTRSPSTSRPRRRGRTRRAACSSGRRCPTTSTRPTCWRARCSPTSRSCRAAPPTSTAAAARRCG